MPADEYAETTPGRELARPASVLVERPEASLGRRSGSLPEIIEVAKRAVTDPSASLEERVLGRFLLHHRPATATEYGRDVLGFARWCWKDRGISLLDADRTMVDLWVHELQANGIRAGTLRRRLAAVQGFYLEAVDAGAITQVPTLRVKRPRVSEGVKLGLSKEEAAMLLEAAEESGPRDAALVRLLLLNGLRASEAAGLRIGDLGRERGHRILTVHRKGGVTTVEAVSVGTSDALDVLLQERGTVSDGDWLFTTEIDETVNGKKVKKLTEQPLSRHGVARVTRRLGRVIDTAEPLNPHELRHAFITLGLDAGATLRDLQRAAAHADPRTTANYDRRRKALDTHPSYLVERYLA